MQPNYAQPRALPFYPDNIRVSLDQGQIDTAKRQATSHCVWTTKKVREESESEKDSEFQPRETDSSEDAAESLKEPALNRPTPPNCTAECCYSTEKVFQPTDKGALATFSEKKKKFSTTEVQTISLGKCLHYLQKGVLYC